VGPESIMNDPDESPVSLSLLFSSCFLKVCLMVAYSAAATIGRGFEAKNRATIKKIVNTGALLNSSLH